MDDDELLEELDVELVVADDDDELDDVVDVVESSDVLLVESVPFELLPPKPKICRTSRRRDSGRCLRTRKEVGRAGANT